MKRCYNKFHEQPCKLKEKCPTCGSYSCWKNWKDFMEQHSCKRRLKTLASRIEKSCERCDRLMKGTKPNCSDCRNTMDQLSKDLSFLEIRHNLNNLNKTYEKRY